MLQRRSERVLLAAVVALLVILAGEQLVVGPLLDYYEDLDRRLAALEADLAEASRLQEEADQVQQRCDYIDARLHEAGEQFQNQFRKYLETRIGPGVQVKRSKQVAEAPLPELPGMKVLRFEMELVGPLAAQRAALAYLATSIELLRIENLRMTRTSPDERSLTVRMTVSTVARSPKVP